MDCMLTITTLVLKFCVILLDRIRPDNSPTSGTRKAIADELWITECQCKSVADKNFQQWQRQLDLFQDVSGLWRCTGRIQNAAVPYSTKHPLLLHKSHHLTVLIVRKAYGRVLHNGVKETLAELRSKFWIMKARNFVKSVIRQCHLCRGTRRETLECPDTPSTSCLSCRRSTSSFFRWS